MWLPLLSALLGIIAFLPANLYPASFVWLVPLFIFFLREKKLWRLVLGALIFRLIFFFGTIYFTLEPIAWSSGLVIFSGLPIAVWLVKKIINCIFPVIANRQRAMKQSHGYGSNITGSPRPAAAGLAMTPHFLSFAICHLSFLLPFLWTFFDLLQARFSLLPSYNITAGNMLGSSPFVGLANFGGLVALTFFVATINALAAGIILNLSPSLKLLKSDFGLPLKSDFGGSSPPFLKGGWEGFKSPFIPLYKGGNKFSFLYFPPALLLLLLSSWQISQYQLRQNALTYNSLPGVLKFAAISANEKFDSNQFNALTKDLISRQIDLVIFPEDILNEPININSLQKNPALLGGQQLFFMQNLAKELGVSLITASDTLQNQRKYNSAILFDSQGNIAGVHNKSRLTFAGEYWPFGNWLPPGANWLKEKDPKISTYAMFDYKNSDNQGEQNLLAASSPLPIASAICMEIQYPSDLKKYKNDGAKFIVNESSNRWISSGTNHFLYLTNNLRKIESVWLKLPIVTGGIKDFAGVILPDGQTQLVNYESENKDYGVAWGEIRY